MPNYYKHFSAFINNNVGKQITRQQLIELCVLKECETTDFTIDNYRNICEKLDYLEKVKRGVFYVAKPLPDNYSMSKLRKDYDTKMRSS